MVDLARVRALETWLINGASGATGSHQVFQRFCNELAASGVPLDRGEAFVRTLHPHIIGRSFLWKPGSDVEVREATWEHLQSDEFLRGPVGHVFATGEFLHTPLDLAIPTIATCGTLGPLAREGFTDFFGAPLKFLSGQVHAMTFTTRRPERFDDEHLEAIRSVIPAISRVGEILALARTAANLLSTYVGHDAGERILAGKIKRGDVDTIRAVIWFSDLRGFTSMSTSLEPSTLIRVLNDIFECQVAAIEKRKGEVLKFIGDGLLGIFPIAADDADARERCDAALDAASEAFGRLETLNATRAKRGEAELRVGLALHVGDIAYGNIGGASRLDFTCIGPAVNIASRLEGVASKLGERLVLSDAFRSRSSRGTRSLGSFELKGVPTAQPVFAPAS